MAVLVRVDFQPQSGAVDVNRVLRDDARLEQLNKVVGGPGYVMPGDIKQQLIRADSTWTVQVATLDYASFNPAINPLYSATLWVAVRIPFEI